MVSRSGLSSGIGPSFSFVARFIGCRKGRSTMSRLTMTRTGYPGRTVSVGWTARSFDTMRCPASFAALLLLCVPLLAASSLEIPSSEESTTPFSSRQVS